MLPLWASFLPKLSSLCCLLLVSCSGLDLASAFCGLAMGNVVAGRVDGRRLTGLETQAKKEERTCAPKKRPRKSS